MPPKKNHVVDGDDEEEVPNKVWKVNPPGPEQKELNRMFEKGLLGGTDTAAKIRLRNQLFTAFPPRTFTLHFRQTKAKFGLNAVSKPTAGNIPEFDGMEEESKPSSSRSPVGFIESRIEARNYPYMAWHYTDHNSQKDMVCVAVPTVTGSRDISFVISEDGTTLFVDFVWPLPLLDPNELFLDVTDEDGSAISMSDPKVYGFRNHLVECELSEKSRPVSSLVINLPIRVLRELGTYSKVGLKCGDTRIAMLEFTGFQKKKVLRDADNSITF